MTSRPTIVAVVILPIAAAASAAFGWAVSGRIEAEVTARAQQAVEMAGAQWASVQTDGLKVVIAGPAPSTVQEATVVKAVTGALSGLPIENQITIAAMPEVFQPDTAFRIMRGVGHLTVTGAVPGEAARASLAASLNASLPSLPLTDLIRTDARGDLAIAGIADDLSAITAELLHGTIIVEGNTISITGIASGRDEQFAIEGRVAALTADQWQVAVSLATPPPRIAELMFHAETGPDGRGLIACTAANAAEAERIRTRAVSLFGEGAACTETPADETPGWGDAVIAALDALAELPAGEVRLTGRRVRMSGAPPTRKKSLEDATTNLRASLPEGFRLMLLTPPPVEPSADAVFQVTGSSFRIDYDGVVMRLSGDAPSAILADTLGSFARATLRGVTIDATEVELRPEVPADDWRKATQGLVIAMAALETGTGEITPERAIIEGTIEQPGQIAELHRLAARSIGAERQVQTRLRVAMNDLAAAQPLLPARCAEMMSDVTRRMPILFAPGSIKIGEASQPVIDRLAEVLTSCSGGRIEIGGHTDNDGPEASNLRLSQQRAEAVLMALNEAGARVSLLTAKGYGEAEPVADNNTDAGRRANRRIAFRAVEEEGRDE